MPVARRPRTERTRRRTLERRLAGLALLVVMVAATGAVIKANGPPPPVPCAQVDSEPAYRDWKAGTYRDEWLGDSPPASGPLKDGASFARALERCRTTAGRSRSWVRTHLGAPTEHTGDERSSRSWSYQIGDGFQDRCKLHVSFDGRNRVREATASLCD